MHLGEIIFNFSYPAVAHWGYWAVFFGALFEAATPAGVFVPGGFMVVLAAFFAKSGALKVGNVFLAAFLGAVVGDCVGFFLGRRFGYQFLERYGSYFFLKREWIERGREIIVAHAGKSIIIGRFNPVTRAIAPFVIGAADVRFSRFFVYVLCGSFIWALLYTFIGFIFGIVHLGFSDYLGAAVIAAVGLGIFFIYRYRIFSKEHYLGYRLPTLIALNLLALLAFAKILGDVLSGFVLNSIDAEVHLALLKYHTPAATSFFAVITNFGSGWFILFGTLVLLAALLASREFRYAGTVVLALGGTALSVFSLKMATSMPRPEDALVSISSDGSFPSAHAALSIVFFGALVYAFWRNLQSKRLQYVALVGALGIVLLVCASRLYLRVHWFSDVLGGIMLGIFWLTFAILLERVLAAFRPTQEKEVRT